MREGGRTEQEQTFDSRFDAAFQPGFDDRMPAPADHDPFGFDTLGGDLGAEAESGAGVPLRPARLVDRFLVAIWAVGVGIVVLGFGGMFASASSYYGVSGGGPDYLAILAMQFSPWLIVVGIATLVGSLFLVAVRSDRRTERRS
ncbi:hypothetical protein [Herbiconiux sp. YIM B11900]|uniref:hypothetical protein n=1 Tax=Herbiconiux sp. YIM B11900 TaxID=3404131 RepID=UPI003F8722B3